MTGLLAELGKKLAEKWLSLLALPGALLLGTVVALWQFSIGTRLADLDTWLSRTATSSGVVAVLLAGTLLTSVGLGFAAQACGTAVRRAWLAEPPFGTLIRFGIPLRRRRWAGLHERAQSEQDPARQQRLTTRRNRIALATPERPTWMSDQMAALTTRVRNAYGLDLPSAWPRLWLKLSQETRTDVQTTTEAFGRASVLAGWALLYGTTAVVFAAHDWLWWPLAIVSAATWLTAWTRARLAIGELATLTEAIIDIHGRDLADTDLTPDLGEQLTERYRKGT